MQFIFSSDHLVVPISQPCSLCFFLQRTKGRTKRRSWRIRKAPIWPGISRLYSFIKDMRNLFFLHCERWLCRTKLLYQSHMNVSIYTRICLLANLVVRKRCVRATHSGDKSLSGLWKIADFSAVLSGYSWIFLTIILPLFLLLLSLSLFSALSTANRGYHRATHLSTYFSFPLPSVFHRVEL